MSDIVIEAYRGKKQGRQAWRWRAVNAGNNRKMANGGEAYSNKGECEAAIRQLFGLDAQVTMRFPGEPIQVLRGVSGVHEVAT